MERKKKKASGQSQPQTQNLIEGGLVLLASELLKIVNQPNCVGLAFGLHQKGTPQNVDLKVYAVTRSGEYLHGNLVNLKKRFGSRNAYLDTPMKSVKKYKFEYEENIVKSGFSFAYLDLEECKRVLEVDKKWVFIAGAKRGYGGKMPIEGDWFTFHICPYPNLNKVNDSDNEKPLGIPPNVRIMDSCPPIWSVDAESHRHAGNNSELVFIVSV